jgi:hypothetical protein
MAGVFAVRFPLTTDKAVRVAAAPAAKKILAAAP